MPKKTTNTGIKGKVKTVAKLPKPSKGWGGLSIGDAMQRVAAKAEAKKKKENSSIDYSIFQKKLYSLLSEAGSTTDKGIRRIRIKKRKGQTQAKPSSGGLRKLQRSLKSPTLTTGEKLTVADTIAVKKKKGRKRAAARAQADIDKHEDDPKSQKQHKFKMTKSGT